MSRHDPPGPDRPRTGRRDRAFLIFGLAIGAAFVLVFVVALAIHFMLLGTDRFNWLEPPKRSDLVSPMRVALSFSRRRENGCARGRDALESRPCKRS